MTPDRLAAALADRYRIEREIGAGGMATVYLAEDLRHNRKVAIKVLREDLAASMGSARFLREIQIAAQLQHPNILPLLDSGEASGLLYYVMPYVHGQSLRERLAREGELPVHEAVRLLVEVTDALAHAHANGVVHRDIKPDNVMMSGRHALVTDFGVAKAISEATGRNTVTTLGVAVGTPAYMSPEQASADPHIDHRSDIYAVGVMAYEMLTGRPPFTGATPQQVLAAHVTEAPDPVSKRRQAISAALEQIVMRCLAKRPADRYQNAEELLHLLESQATPSTGITPTQMRPMPATSATQKRWMIPATAALTVLALTVVLWQLRRGSDRPERIEATPTQVTFTGTAEFTASLSPDGQRIAYAHRRCGDAFVCTYDLVVEDIGGAGSLRVVEGMQAIYDVSWTGNGRSLLMGGLRGGDQVAYYLLPALGGVAPRLISSSAVRMFGPGDSILVGSQLSSDRVAIRSTTFVDPTRGDSMIVERPDLGAFDWSVSPSGQLLVAGYRVGDARRLVLLDRLGRPLDSLEAAGIRSAGFVSDRQLVLGIADSINPSLIRIEEHQVGLDGHLTGTVREIGSAIPTRNFNTSTGGIAYLAGTIQTTVMAISRGAGASGAIERRPVASSTGMLGSLMGSDGTYLILERRDPGNPNASRLSVQPFEGGEERLIGGAQLNAGSTRSRTVDGRGLVVLTRNGDQTDIAEIDLSTGRSTPRGSMAHHGQIRGLEAMSDGGLAWQPEERESGIMIRSPAGEIRTIRTPQVVTETMEDSPYGGGLLGWGYSTPNFDSLVVWHLPPGATEARPLVKAVFDYIPGHRWLPDGNAELVINETLSTSAFYHLDVSTGALTRQATIPINFINAVSFSNDGRRLAARVTVPTHDVWTIRWE